jgi:hypothetical protein
LLFSQNLTNHARCTSICPTQVPLYDVKIRIWIPLSVLRLGATWLSCWILCLLLYTHWVSMLCFLTNALDRVTNIDESCTHSFNSCLYT